MLMKRKKLISVGIVLALTVAGSFWYFRSQDPDEGIEMETVSRADVVQTVSVTGELVPVRYADLSFGSVGTVQNVFVKQGDEVTKGMALATIDTSVLESQLRSAKLAADVAYEAEKLAVRNHLKKEEIAAKKLSAKEARERIGAIATQIERSALVAPMDGIVSRADLRVGELTKLGTPVARIIGGSDLVAEAQVSESDVIKIRSGMSASVTFDALTRNDVLRAMVGDIDATATVIQDVISYRTKFTFEQLDDRLKDGMTANIDIETARAAGALSVPFRAITKESGESFVEIRRGPGVYDRVEIKTGIEGDDGTIEVKSGLNDGDVVIVSRKK